MERKNSLVQSAKCMMAFSGVFPVGLLMYLLDMGQSIEISPSVAKKITHLDTLSGKCGGKRLQLQNENGKNNKQSCINNKVYDTI